MNPIHLHSVNFEQGMLLTPEHFLRQERYFDSGILWLLRYTSSAAGLVGAGSRAEDGDCGSARYDPVITVVDEDEFVHVTVSNCRALTLSGCPIEIPPEDAVSQRFAKAGLEGAATCGIYLIAVPHEKQAVDGPIDEANPQMQTERRPQYRLSLQPPGQHGRDCLAIARIRKSRYGTGYEKESDYIPACASMAAHSELAAGWRRITEELALLHDRLIELYRAMPEFLTVFRERGIDTDIDAASQSLVAQILPAVQICLHETLDPLLPPGRFFGHLRRMFHFAALEIELNPQVQGYFETLRENGETEFVALLEAQRRMARRAVQIQLADDLSVEVRGALQSLADLRRLEEALSGKYLDFRLNRSLESMNFIFERGGKVLYRLAARPSRMQATVGDCVITFAQLRLEGREKYRLVLIGERNAVFDEGARVAIEIRINEGSGFRRTPTVIAAEPRMAEQCNFDFDFDAPDVPTITDLRVSFPSHHAIRTALLYVRQRFYASSKEDRAAMEPRPSGTTRSEQPAAGLRGEANGPRRSMPQPGPQPGASHFDPAQQPANRMEPVRDAGRPWENRRAVPEQANPDPPPPRRRRLE